MQREHVPTLTFYGITCVLLLVAAAAPRITAAGHEAEGQRWWKHIEYLADDKLEGRNTGSPGHRKAAEYIAGEFERAMTARYVVTNALCTLHALEFAGTRTGSLRGDVLRLVEEVRP